MMKVSNFKKYMMKYMIRTKASFVGAFLMGKSMKDKTEIQLPCPLKTTKGYHVTSSCCIERTYCSKRKAWCSEVNNCKYK